MVKNVVLFRCSHELGRLGLTEAVKTSENEWLSFSPEGLIDSSWPAGGGTLHFMLEAAPPLCATRCLCYLIK